MIKIISYPKRIFDYMVKNKKYTPGDSFISIGYSFIAEDDESVLPSNERCIRVLFDDVIDDAEFPTIGGEVTKVHVISSKQAQDLLIFGLAANSNSTIHIHCFAGQSRSVAVAQGLEFAFKQVNIPCDIRHTKIDITPNSAVLSAIHKELFLLPTLNL